MSNIKKDVLAEARAIMHEDAVSKGLALAGFDVAPNLVEQFDEKVIKSANAKYNAKNKVMKSASVDGKVKKSGGNIGYEVDPSTGLVATPDGVGTTAALRRESLESKLINTTYGKNQFIFYDEIMKNKRPANSTVVQYTLFDRHSPVGHGMTNYEGKVSSPTDPHMIRKTLPMKYISKTSNISLQAAISSSIEDPITVYETEALTDMISQIEWESYYGDANLSSTTEPNNGTEFDGLIKLIPEQNVIDNGGKPLDANVLSEAVMDITTAQGTPTDAFMPAGVKATFVNTIQNNNQLGQISIKDNNNSTYNYGFSVAQYISPNSGTGINLNGSNVMNLPEQYDNKGIDPTIDALMPDVEEPTIKTDDGGKFRTDHEVGKTLNYQFSTFMSDGRSTRPKAVSVALPAGGEKSSINFKIKIPAIGQATGEYVTVYRQGEDGFFWALTRIGLREVDKDGYLNFTDKNEKIAGTFDVFVGDMSKDVISMFELLPIDFLPLAQLNATYTWTYLWFGALALLVPQRWVRITNVSGLTAQFPH